MKSKNLVINGNNLKIKDIIQLTAHTQNKIKISSLSLKQVEKSHDFLLQTIEQNNQIIYGVNTGFGPMASYILPKAQLVKLQNNLVFSHAVGMGEKLPDNYVLSAMVVRLNTLAKGYSGVSKNLLHQLESFINHRIIPVIPEHGAVGTSGDLVQLAHIALALIGHGNVFVNGTITTAKTALKKFGLKPYVLKPKEGLSLINGTSMMTGIGALVADNAERLVNLSLLNSCLALEIMQAYDDSYSEKLHSLRPHYGQVEIAKKMREILSSSKLIRNRKILNKNSNNGNSVNKIPETVQEVYSLRCIAQILGPIKDILHKTWREVETEINSVTDNPIVDWQNKQFLHGGNFHGEYIAQSMDQLKTALIKMTMLTERRLNFFLNPNINKGLPPFVNLGTPGLTLALQGLQFVATSTTANSQTLGFPMNLHSISTNGDNQDVVSMGTDAALFASKVVDNAYIVLAIESLTLCQTVDFFKIEGKLSVKTKNLYDKIRKIFSVVVEDREITQELLQITNMLKGL